MDKSAYKAVGDAASDEAARGEGKRGAAAADETTGRLRSDVSSVDEALRTTVWRTVTDEVTAKRGSVGNRFRRSHRTAAVVIASAENPCGWLWGVSSLTRLRAERGAEAETIAANEVPGLPLIRRDGCGRVAADEVACWEVEG